MVPPPLLEQFLFVFSQNATWFFFLAFRYLREIVSLFAFVLHTNISIPQTPSLTSQDVTVVLPSLDGDGEGLEKTLLSILETDPYEVILVTVQANQERASKMVTKLGMTAKVRVLAVAQPNKRRQMVRAIPEITTKITIFADDDVRWPETLLPHMLAPLEDESYGGVGTNQRVQRKDGRTILQAAWAFLGSAYLMRRNFDCASCNHIDGGLPCLSGRTVAYRTEIINDDGFMYGFTNETWGLLNRDDYKLNTDDDNFLTRWLVNHGHKIKFQHHPEAEVLTDLEENSNYLKQCLRWSRSNWRSNLTSMFIERSVWKTQPWSSYSVFQTTLTHYSIVWDILLFLYRPQSIWATTLLGSLWLATKTGKLMPHFLRWPGDLVWLPLSIVFGWLHTLIKLHAAVTLWETTWGSREGADANDTDRMVYAPSHRFEPSGVIVHASSSGEREAPMLASTLNEKFNEKFVRSPRRYSQVGRAHNTSSGMYRVKDATPLLPLHHASCSREFSASIQTRFTGVAQLAIIT